MATCYETSPFCKKSQESQESQDSQDIIIIKGGAPEPIPIVKIHSYRETDYEGLTSLSLPIKLLLL
jgi:hypothetical protein